MRTVAIVVSLALLLPATALASHTGQYALNPVEHDDQGRGVEPDGAGTAVLGPLVRNKVVDWNGDGLADPDPDPLPPPPAGHSRFINPGCMGDGEVPVEGHNRLSGQCGLWTVGVGHVTTGTVVPRHTVPPPVSEDGRCQAPGPVTYPPGRFSGDACPGNAVTFLDVFPTACTHALLGVNKVQVNRKVDDTPLAGTVLGEDALVGPTCFWGWYGTWQDKNGNGVIDHRAAFNLPNAQGTCAGVNPPCDGLHTVAQYFPDDEFVWLGNCMRFPGIVNPGSVRSGYCAFDVEAAAGGRTVMAGWVWPGNHHGFCGGALDPLFLTCTQIPADLPGRQALHFVGAVLYHQTGGVLAVPCAPTLGNPNLGLFCELDIEELDETDERYTGDPLLGPQGGVRPDQTFDDRVGDPSPTIRQWVYGLGWAAYFYDSSLLSRVVMVTGVGCQPGGPNAYLLLTCRRADVDRYDAWSPEADELLRGTVKPTLRANWVLVRDSYFPALRQADGLVNHRLLTLDDLEGPLNDKLVNPGFSREPNDPQDRFPGAAFNARGCAVPGPGNNFADGQAMHHGWCNDYAAHRAGPRAYADLLHLVSLHENRPVVVNTLTVLGIAGSFLSTTDDPLAAHGGTPVARADGDHRRTLVPGKHLFRGLAGMWHDQAHTWEEPILADVPPLGMHGGRFTHPADGWVGNLVETLGAWHYRGYGYEACDTDQPAWAGPNGDLHSWAACHPYRDGEVENPQAYGVGQPLSPTSGVREWSGQCNGIGSGGAVPPPAGLPAYQGVLTLVPADGTWDVPVLVWRDHFQGVRIAVTGGPGVHGLDIVDLTGTQGPIELHARCSEGLQGGRVAVHDMLILPLGNLDETIHATIEVRVGVETVVDADTFHAWGLGA